MHALLMVMFLFSTMACAQEEVATKPILTLEGAKKIMVAAEASANKNKAKVVIAIVDEREDDRKLAGDSSYGQLRHKLRQFQDPSNRQIAHML